MSKKYSDLEEAIKKVNESKIIMPLKLAISSASAEYGINKNTLKQEFLKRLAIAKDKIKFKKGGV